MKNNKGFMMAEVIIVSAIVLATLATLAVSYNRILGNYNSKLSYYDSMVLFRLAYFRDTLIDKDLINGLIGTHNSVAVIYDTAGGGVLSDGDIEKLNNMSEKVYLINNNQASVAENVLSTYSVNETFSDYISYLNKSVNLSETNFVLVMEQCNIEDGKTDDCKYAYLEVKDGYELPK